MVDKLSDRNDIYREIMSELEKCQFVFTLYEHQSVATSIQAAQVRNTPLLWGAKSIIMYADGKPIMVVVPGNTKIDTKALKQFINAKDLRMATSEEVLQVTSLPIGAVPPFGHYFSIPLYMDTAIQKNAQVVFNAGLRNKSIKMKERDYEKMSKPIIGKFSKPIS
jgi:prolyl-tRNA editing enzyme YbaK/EbsC (Cys-tRNA(Pro) deacylase)